LCWSLVAMYDDVADVLMARVQGDREGHEGIGADAFGLVDQTQQDVLGADVVVVEQPGFVLCQDDDAAGAIGEAFEHGPPPSDGGDVSRLRACAPESSPVRRGRDAASLPRRGPYSGVRHIRVPCPAL